MNDYHSKSEVGSARSRTAHVDDPFTDDHRGAHTTAGQSNTLGHESKASLSHWVVLLIVIVLVGLFLGWIALRIFDRPVIDKKPPPPVPVHTSLVGSRAVTIKRSAMGTVIPLMSVTVHARIDGQLQAVDFKEGQHVTAGQTLVHIDARTYKAQYDQALAQKAKDEASYENARLDLGRYESLMAQDATTRQTLDTQRALVGQLKAAIANDDAQIELSRINLSYTTIKAPIAGRAGARLVDPGNIVHAADSTGLLVINQIDPIGVQFALPESSFQLVNAAIHNSASSLVVLAIDRTTHQELAKGKLALLNNQIDTSTGTIMLKGEFPNAQHKLWPGQSIQASIELGTIDDALVIPASVVQRGPQNLFAYVVDEGKKVSMVPIEIDAANSNTDYAIVTAGLDLGQRVVTQGQYRLNPGDLVALLPSIEPSNPKSSHAQSQQVQSKPQFHPSQPQGPKIAQGLSQALAPQTTARAISPSQGTASEHAAGALSASAESSRGER